jgi:quinol monooxygenase YgiN
MLRSHYKCRLYALHEGADGRLVMIEKYTSPEAVAAHSKSPELAELIVPLKGKLGADGRANRNQSWRTRRTASARSATT